MSALLGESTRNSRVPGMKTKWIYFYIGASCHVTKGLDLAGKVPSLRRAKWGIWSNVNRPKVISTGIST